VLFCPLFPFLVLVLLLLAFLGCGLRLLRLFRLLGIVHEFVTVLVVVVGNVIRVGIVGFGLTPGLVLLGDRILVGGTASALEQTRS
jgi:hypothetical protein